MGTVQRIDGSFVEDVQLTNIRPVGDEGARSATAHIDGKEYGVHNSIVDGFTDIWYEQTTVEEWKAWKDAHRLHIQGETYTAQGQALTPGMYIRRWDSAGGGWFEGEVCIVYGYSPETHARYLTLGLKVPGYAPSPLVEDDVVVVVSDQEET